MQEIGILSGLSGLGLDVTYYSVIDDKFVFSIISSDKVLIINGDDSSENCKINVLCNLTQIGKEVVSLCKVISNKEYLISVGKKFVKKGFSVMLADIVSKEGSRIKYNNAILLSENVQVAA